MATFTEQAVLQVKDAGATANIRKINAELKKLFATAKSLKSIKVLKVNARPKPGHRRCSRPDRCATSIAVDRSAGLPLRMRPVYWPAQRCASVMLPPVAQK